MYLNRVSLESVEEETKKLVVSLENSKNPRMVRVNKQLPNDFKEALKGLFRDYKDVFAWEHADLKGKDP